MKLKLSESEAKRLEQAAVQRVLQRAMTAAIEARADAIEVEIGDTETTGEAIVERYCAIPVVQAPSLLVPK